MTATTTDNVTLVRTGYEAFARGDMSTLGRVVRPDATWTHRNAGRFTGPKHGFDAIAAFFGESVQLTGGTFRVEPVQMLSGEGDEVAMIVRMTAQRPDGRTLDDVEMHVFALRDGAAAAVDQYIGDPPAVEAFWA